MYFSKQIDSFFELTYVHVFQESKNYFQKMSWIYKLASLFFVIVRNFTASEVGSSLPEAGRIGSAGQDCQCHETHQDP